jgi:FSR family fosmidomycin resistance protein-like MFS transporter
VLKRYWQRLILLAFGHGLNDFAAGYMLGNLLYLNTSIEGIGISFLLYNLLAFGGQFVAAKLIQKYRDLKTHLTVAAIANVIAVFLFHLNPQFSLVLAGCASAVYHVAGGSACIKENRATEIGVFAAPGIVGLAIAGYLSYLRIDVWSILLITTALFVFVIRLVCFPKAAITQAKENEKHITIDQHDMLMIFLLGVISLRSAIWNIFQIIHEHNYTWIIAIAASAFAGKILGGYISDRIGWKLYSFLSLITAMPLVTFFKDEIILFCIGIGLLQSSIPANTAMIIEYYKGLREKGIAFSFGTAIVLGLLFTAPIKLFSINSFVLFLMVALVVFSFLLIRKRATIIKQ